MSNTRILPCSGREVVFMDRHIKTDVSSRSLKRSMISRLLRKKGDLSIEFTQLYNRMTICSAYRCVEIQDEIQAIDDRLSDLGLVNH